MRLRIGLVFCLFATIAAVGCREALAPNIDNNRPPETWITAAPFDTITVVDGTPPPINRIPVRFHVYWAGSDHDGSIAGFYWAVTETLPVPPDPENPVLPQLPGPKPADYRFTTKTDSIFIFRVAEEVNDRQHAFFIYAVDNLGKPDPTPARFIFIAQDDYPPIPQFIEAIAVGTVYELTPGGTLVARQERDTLTDVDNGPRNVAPRDTVPANATLTFRWIGVPQIAGSVVTKYKYKLDEPAFIEVPASVTTATYNSRVGADTVRVNPGIKVFTVRAFDQAEGRSDATRRFQLNYAPDTWFSGPDRGSPLWQSYSPTQKYRFIKLLDHSPTDPGGFLPPGGMPNSLLSPDSLTIMPALRVERRSFFEVYNDTLWYREEGDTVHLNSYVLFYTGGFDRDSDYNVRVSELAMQQPGFPGGPVLTPVKAPTGSAVGFRAQINTSLAPNNFASPGVPSNLYPLFDPNDPLDSPASRRIGYYQPVIQSGRAYAWMKAVDGDRETDRRIIDGLALGKAVDAGGGTPEQEALRPKVIAFEVGFPPHFRTDLPSFQPLPNHVYTGGIWQFNVQAADVDPFEVGRTPAGGPDQTTYVRRRVMFRYTNAGGQADSVLFGDDLLNRPDFNVNILDPVRFPRPIQAGPVILDLEICDCIQCDAFTLQGVAGRGRCSVLRVPVSYVPAGNSAVSPPSTRPGTE